jgi:hypothetical protein
MIFALAVGIGLFAGGVLVVARWRGQVAVRRELGAAARRVRGGSLDKEHGRKHAGMRRRALLGSKVARRRSTDGTAGAAP